MTDCIRRHEFGANERHKCFVLGCNQTVNPSSSNTCPICDLKPCAAGHCGCNLSPEALYAVKVFYETFCEYCEGAKKK